jgi:hypothetical protein
LEPYGVCFTKDFIVREGGQPALYINEYDGNTWHRDSLDELFEQSVTDRKVVTPLWRILPFVNSMHEGHDFSWEREWRIDGDLRFTNKDIVCVILPAERESALKRRLTSAGIATISPGWTYEQIVGELSKQQRTTRSLAKALE